jgi:putative membrane protein
MKPYRIILLALFVAIGVWSFIGTHSVTNWILESSPSIIFVALIAILDRRLGFSDFSYISLIIYFALPFVNAHYGVAHVPFGETLGHWFGTERNSYDRLVHFAAGLMCFIPLRELFIRITKDTKIWSYTIPFMFVMGLGALYEVGELVSALINPKAGITFTGAQGDIWDASKDLAWGGVGALITIAIVLIVVLAQRKETKKK